MPRRKYPVWLGNRVQGWQYNPYGSRRHAFAWTLLTGHTIAQSIWAAIINRSGRVVKKHGTTK